MIRKIKVPYRLIRRDINDHNYRKALQNPGLEGLPDEGSTHVRS